MKPTEVPEEVLQILRSLNGQGLLQDALLQMATVSGGSSMSDAAKRRGDEISESDGFQLVRDSPKTAGSDVLTQVSEDGAVTVRGVPLPRGVTDLDTWGRTVCTLPKVEKRGMNFDELIKESKTCPDTLRCLRWVRSNAPISAKVKDLGDFMSLKPPLRSAILAPLRCAN
jgi:hypothetical protein